VFSIKGPIQLSSKERQIVRQTWPALVNDLQGNGLQLFLRIFELCPEVKALFHVDNVRHSQLARNVNIKAHGKRFISAIGAAVDSVDEFDKEDNEFFKFLFSLGQQHQRYAGFRPEYFEIFHEALMRQWELCMGNQFTKEVSESWSHLFVYLMGKLKEGYLSHAASFEAHLKSKNEM
jgi:hemoglobin-like flavoprotein